MAEQLGFVVVDKVEHRRKEHGVIPGSEGTVARRREVNQTVNPTVVPVVIRALEAVTPQSRGGAPTDSRNNI